MAQLEASFVQNLGSGFEASGITFVNRPYEESLIYVISDDARPEYLIEIDEYGSQRRINIAANLDAEAISYDIKNQTLVILDEGNFSTRKPGRIITLQLDEEGHVATNEGSANILRIQDIPLNPTGTNNGYEALVVDSIQSRIYIGEQDSGRIHCFEFINGEIKERIQTVEAGVNDLSAITLINQGEGRQLLATLHGKSSYINNEFLGPGKSYLQLIDPNTGDHIFSSEITGNFNDLEGMVKIEDKLILTDDAGANGNGKLLSISLNDIISSLPTDPTPPLNQDWQLISSNPDGTLSLWFDPNSQLAAIKNGTDPHQVISRNDSYWSGDIPLNRDQATLIAIARDDNDQIRVLDHGSSGFYGWILDNNATFIGETAYTANDLSSAETTFAIDLDGDGLFNGLLPNPNPPLKTETPLLNKINQLIENGKLRLTEPDVDAMPKTSTGEVMQPMIAENFTQAVPSNDWWSSVVFPEFGDAYSAPLYAHPLTIKVEEKGLSLSSQSQREAFQTSDTTWESITPFHRQLQVQVLSEEAEGFELITYGDWSFTGGWQQPGDRPELTVAQGSPITWLKGVKANDINISWQGESEEQSLEGSKLNIKINQDHYAVYSSAGIWTQNEGNIRLATEEDAVVDLAVALVPKGATAETIKKFDDSASTRITTTEFGFTKDANPYNISISYEYGSQIYPDNTNTLFAIYPHLKNIVNGSFNTGETYESARGQMDLHEGNSFHAEIPALGVLPMLPMVLSEIEKEEARAKLLNDSEINNPSSYLNQFGDTYWSGKALLKSIQSAHLAKALGEDDLSAKIVNAVTETLDDWFEASGEAGDRHFAYNPIWDTVQGYPDSFGSASQLNDHHFHYGYFIHAAALAGLLNPSWIETQRDMVDLLINDVAGWDLTDASLPELRNFSTMAGHSWASGHGAFGRGNNHESSSESMNFSTGLTLWGGITNRDKLTNLGQTLYSLEAKAIQEYWFEKNQQIHPDGYNVESSGMLWGDGAAHATWFSAEPEHIKGINFLPFSGGSLYLSEMARDPSALISEIDELTGEEIDQWGGLILQYEALFNQQGALEKKDILIEQLEEGQSKVGVYSWIHALANLGTPTSTIRANHPLSAVFINEEITSYTAFNPGDSPLAVAFNDGHNMTIDPMQLLTQTLDQNAIVQENSLSYL